MRLALVNPSYQARVRRIAQTTVGPPLGLAYLAGAARRAGHATSIVDANALGLGPREAAERALAGRPGVVGLTATTPTVHLAAAIAREVKRRSPDVHVVVGGPHATALPARTLREFPEFDRAARGEAERSLPLLLDALAAGGDAAARVPGFVVRGPDGALVDTGAPPVLADLDGLEPPARDLLPMDRYRGVDSDTFTTLLAMRGCPWECVYCAVPGFYGRGMRYRNPAAVAQEMADVHARHGVDFFSFVDDTFTTRRDWVLSFCEELERLDLPRRVRWVCLTRADMVDLPLLQRMRAAGCVRVEMGIESGSERGRAYLRKGLTEDAVLAGFRAAKAAGLSTMSFAILNIPGETEEDVERTLDLVLRADPDFLQVSFLTPYPGTQLHEDASRDGLVSTEDWSRYSFLQGVVLRNPHFTEQQLQALYQRFVRRFWLRPRTAIKLAGLVLSGTTRVRPLARTVARGLAALALGATGAAEVERA